MELDNYIMTDPMITVYGLDSFRNRILKEYPQATFKFFNLKDKLYTKVDYKGATVHINHYKFDGGTDFDYEYRGIIDYSDYDFINPICIGSVSKVINSMVSHVLNYFKHY